MSGSDYGCGIVSVWLRAHCCIVRLFMLFFFRTVFFHSGRDPSEHVDHSVKLVDLHEVHDTGTGLHHSRRGKHQQTYRGVH